MWIAEKPDPTAMKTSDLRNNKDSSRKFHPPPNWQKSFADAKTLLDAILRLPIEDKIRKCILREGLWVVYYACTGDRKNKKKNWFARFRSRDVKAGATRAPVREHVFRLEHLLKKLNSDNIHEIATEATFVCHVTKEEDEKLSKVDRKLEGWARYDAAGIAAYDMQAEPPRWMAGSGEERA